MPSGFSSGAMEAAKALIPALVQPYTAAKGLGIIPLGDDVKKNAPRNFFSTNLDKEKITMGAV